MIDNDLVVIDSVTHAFDAREEFRSEQPQYEYGWHILESTYQFHRKVMPHPYCLTRAEWYHRFSVDELEAVLFRESATDYAFYHSIPGAFWPDLSPIETGIKLRKRHPHRVGLYGRVSPLDNDAADSVERQVEEWGVSAIKLYPVDFVDGELKPWHMNDERRVYPILERCRELGIYVVAVHKAVPVATAPTASFRPDDVEEPAAAFPELTFELVHGGFNFLEETAFQLDRFPNIVVNLENTSGLIVTQPARFARILGELLLWGGADKVVWGTGACAFHPRPLLDAFAQFDFPEELKTSLGYPTVTREIRKAVLGDNAVRIHRLDMGTHRPHWEHDAVARWREQPEPEPWSELRQKERVSR